MTLLLMRFEPFFSRLFRFSVRSVLPGVRFWADRQDLALPLASCAQVRSDCVHLFHLCPSVSKIVWLRLRRAVTNRFDTFRHPHTHTPGLTPSAVRGASVTDPAG